jgi:hypothetical protein
MKTVKMQGGLGNQLFCLAFARSVARLGACPVAIDLAAFGADRYGRTFDLRELTPSLGDFRLVQTPLAGGRFTTALLRALPLPRYVSEGNPPADAAALALMIARGAYFNGYWQDERYISDPQDLIAATRAFAFERATSARVCEVAIHYRTYKEEIRPERRRGPGGDYVRGALARIESRLGPVREVCLVSDDPSLAMRRLGDIGRDIAVVREGCAWDDMALLMRARALVLTNSSFSWWGGYCGEAEATIYPRRDGFFHYPTPATRFECV